MTCPHCASQNVHRSRRGNAGVMCLVRLLAVCLRCHDCGEKHYRATFAFGARLPSLLVWAHRDPWAG